MWPRPDHSSISLAGRWSSRCSASRGVDGLAEDCEDRDRDGLRVAVRACLHVVRCCCEQLVPVAEDEVLDDDQARAV